MLEQEHSVSILLMPPECDASKQGSVLPVVRLGPCPLGTRPWNALTCDDAATTGLLSDPAARRGEFLEEVRSDHRPAGIQWHP